MIRWHIRDREESPQRYKLGALLRFVADHDRTGASWQVNRASGYGESICSLDDRLQGTKGALRLAKSDLLSICNDPDQWFYDLDCTDERSGFRFGVFDSSVLFFESEDDLSVELAGHFSEVSVCRPS